MACSEGPTNDERADWAQEALDVFCMSTSGKTFTQDVLGAYPYEDTDAPDMLRDLITNLLHLARRNGVDLNEMPALLQGCLVNFEEEVEEEEDFLDDDDGKPAWGDEGGDEEEGSIEEPDDPMLPTDTPVKIVLVGPHSDDPKLWYWRFPGCLSTHTSYPNEHMAKQGAKNYLKTASWAGGVAFKEDDAYKQPTAVTVFLGEAPKGVWYWRLVGSPQSAVKYKTRWEARNAALAHPGVKSMPVYFKDELTGALIE